MTKRREKIYGLGLRGRRISEGIVENKKHVQQKLCKNKEKYSD